MSEQWATKEAKKLRTAGFTVERVARDNKLPRGHRNYPTNWVIEGQTPDGMAFRCEVVMQVEQLLLLAQRAVS